MAILKDLIVHGSSRFLNKIYANELETSAFEADSAVIKKLKADEATVVGLLDVQGQLHTNTWTNSNIATIDGCFYITPTIGSDSGNIVFSSVNVASLTGDFTGVDSLYIGGSSSGSTVQWTSDSKVLLTGEVEVNGQWLPLGTLLGMLSANAGVSSIGLKELKDNRHNDSSIITDIRNAVGNTSLNYRNLKISLYQRASDSKLYPMGIYMTALGSNNKTFIDIYGGVQDTSKAQGGGFTKPNVRIGNLSGLDSIGSISPVGWGIYTTNGYFDGVIVSNRGNIGGWNLTADSIWKNNQNFGNASGMYFGANGISLGSTFKVTNTGVLTATAGTIAGWRIESSYLASGTATGPTTNTLLLSPGGTSNSYTIANQAKTGWMITAGTTFGVNKDGGVYATAGKIGGFDIGTSSIKNTKTSYSETTNNGVWVGTDGIGLGKGLFYVTPTGALTAKSGSIAGWSFNASSLYKTNATPGYNASTMVLSTGTSSTYDIGGTTGKTWMISAGTGFGVTTTGALYCNNAHVSGEITATSGEIGGINITNGKLDVSAINIGDLSGEIGGRNLLRYTLTPCADLAKIGAPSSYWSTVIEDNIQCIKGTGNNTAHLFSYINDNLNFQTEFLKANTTYTYSAWIKVSKAADFNFTHYGHFQVSNNASTASDKTHEDIVSERIYEPKIIPANTWTKIRLTFTTNDLNGSTFGLYPIYNNGADTVIYMYGWKLEKGNRATDWTPAPEDVDVGITSAATTASNYLYASSEGLKIANANPSTNAYYQLQKADRTAFYVNNNKRSEITANGFYIYDNNSNQIASFDASVSNNPTITLGKTNNKNVKINNNGITINDGQETLATYGDSIIIGKQNESHLTMSSTNISAFKNTTEKYYEIGDGSSEVPQSYTVPELPLEITLAHDINSITSVKVNGTTLITDAYDWSSDSSILTILDRTPYAITSLEVAYKYVSAEGDDAEDDTITDDTEIFRYNAVSLEIETDYTIGNNISISQITIDGTPLSSSDYTINNDSVTLNQRPASGSEVVITYYFVNHTPYFIFNTRDNNYNKGNASASFGTNGVASGDSSFVLGIDNKATGRASTCGGIGSSVSGAGSGAIGNYLSVIGNGTFACGRYNVPESAHLFSVGNGTATARSNAFSVSEGGTGRFAGDLQVNKRILMRGQLRGGIPNGGYMPMFSTKTYTKIVGDIAANSTATGLQLSITRRGYLGMAVSGMRILNYSGGSYAHRCNVYIYTIVNNSSESHITFSIANLSSNKATNVKVEFTVFYITRNAVLGGT